MIYIEYRDKISYLEVKAMATCVEPKNIRLLCKTNNRFQFNIRKIGNKMVTGVTERSPKFIVRDKKNVDYSR